MKLADAVVHLTPRGEESPFAGPPRRLQPPDARLCPLCKGMRFLAYDVPVGHALFGKTTPCLQCSARQNGKEG